PSETSRWNGGTGSRTQEKTSRTPRTLRRHNTGCRERKTPLFPVIPCLTHKEGPIEGSESSRLGDAAKPQRVQEQSRRTTPLSSPARLGELHPPRKQHGGPALLQRMVRPLGPPRHATVQRSPPAGHDPPPTVSKGPCQLPLNTLA